MAPESTPAQAVPDRRRPGHAGSGRDDPVTRRTAVLVGVAAIVMLVVAGGFAASRLGGSAGAPARRISSRRRPRPASTTPTPATSRSRSVAASRPSTATATAGPSCTSPAGAIPRRCTATTAPSAARSGSRRSTTRRPTWPTSRAPTRSTSTATARSTWPSCAPARACSCAASATAGSSAPTRPGRSTAAPGWRPRSAPPGRARRACPTLAVGDYLTLDASGQPTQDCAENQLYRPAGAAARLRRADRADARATARSRCCSATGTAPAGGTCGSATTATTTTRPQGEEQLWRIAPGEPPRLYTAPTAGPRSRSRGWASAPTTSPATAIPRST